MTIHVYSFELKNYRLILVLNETKHMSKSYNKDLSSFIFQEYIDINCYQLKKGKCLAEIWGPSFVNYVQQ